MLGFIVLRIDERTEPNWTTTYHHDCGLCDFIFRQILERVASSKEPTDTVSASPICM